MLFTVVCFLQVLRKHYLLYRAIGPCQMITTEVVALTSTHSSSCPHSPSCWLLLPQLTQMNRPRDTPQGIWSRLEEHQG